MENLKKDEKPWETWTDTPTAYNFHNRWLQVINIADWARSCLSWVERRFRACVDLSIPRLVPGQALN